MSVADLIVEREVLANNLASGLCVEKPASKRQDAIRRRRIAEIDRQLSA